MQLGPPYQHIILTQYTSRVNESSEMLNGTSAQLGYTVPFTLVQTGKYRTEDKMKIQRQYRN